MAYKLTLDFTYKKDSSSSNLVVKNSDSILNKNSDRPTISQSNNISLKIPSIFISQFFYLQVKWRTIKVQIQLDFWNIDIK